MGELGACSRTPHSRVITHGPHGAGRSSSCADGMLIYTHQPPKLTWMARMGWTRSVGGVSSKRQVNDLYYVRRAQPAPRAML
jgi:hypothetical protein